MKAVIALPVSTSFWTILNKQSQKTVFVCCQNRDAYEEVFREIATYGATDVIGMEDDQIDVLKLMEEENMHEVKKKRC